MEVTDLKPENGIPETPHQNVNIDFEFILTLMVAIKVVAVLFKLGSEFWKLIRVSWETNPMFIWKTQARTSMKGEPSQLRTLSFSN